MKLETVHSGESHKDTLAKIQEEKTISGQRLAELNKQLSTVRSEKETVSQTKGLHVVRKLSGRGKKEDRKSVV